MKIAVGAAKGLAFLHESEKPVIYRDFKTSNILLDAVSYFETLIIFFFFLVINYALSNETNENLWFYFDNRIIQLNYQILG